MLTKLCLSLFFLSWIVLGIRVEDNGSGGSEIDNQHNSPRFPMVRDMNKGDRIHGGEEAGVGQFPHQISLRRNDSGHFCGGSILNERFILTAGHCVEDKESDTLRVVVGAHENNDVNGTFHDVERLIIHEDYSFVWNNMTRIVRNDIALVQTTTPIQFNDLVRPIRLHPEFIEIADAVASGWGETNDRIYNSKYVNVTTVTNDECRRILIKDFPSRPPPPVHDNDTICASAEYLGNGVCNGDSGGPLTVDNQLVGIVSWGYYCGIADPEGYTRVSTYIDWINSNMEKFQDI